MSLRGSSPLNNKGRRKLKKLRASRSARHYKITARFLKRKLAEYEEIKQQIKEIATEAEKDGTIDLLSDDTLKRLTRTP